MFCPELKEEEEEDASDSKRQQNILRSMFQEPAALSQNGRTTAKRDDCS
jgi:hypothetical protein